jgi:small subunit ribosomal protein S6
MATEAPIYDLMLMLSTSAEDEQRAKILRDVESAITGAGGSVERNDDWGQRAMTYEIRHQPEAEYHLLQFKAPPTLIEELSHTLRITDGVLRLRVIKVRPGTPDAPSSPPPVVAAVAAAGHGGGGPGERVGGAASGERGDGAAERGGAGESGGSGESPRETGGSGESARETSDSGDEASAQS